MRHKKKFNHLSRTASHRKAMLSNMASSLIKHKRINTTVAKAKALRVYVEPLITKSKNDTTHSRRIVFSYLQDKDAVSELFRDVSKKVAERPGGYTRIIKTGSRLGDNAEMCLIELVDYNENLLHAGETKKKTRRSRRGGGKKSESPQSSASAAPAKEVKTETPAEIKTAAAADEAAPAVEEVETKAEEAAVEAAPEEVAEEKTEVTPEVEAKAEVETPEVAETQVEEPAKEEEAAEVPAAEETPAEEPKAEAAAETETGTEEPPAEEKKDEENSEGEEEKKSE